MTAIGHGTRNGFLKPARICALAFMAALLCAQVTEPALDQAYGGDRDVTGQAAPGSAPLTVYDATSNTKIYLGAGKSIDQQGYFAVAVDPPLVTGHRIVVTDSQGRSSAVMTVVAKSGPTGSPN
jgi:hypothetical protein